jgi:hypothetical protein
MLTTEDLIKLQRKTVTYSLLFTRPYRTLVKQSGLQNLTLSLRSISYGSLKETNKRPPFGPVTAYISGW